MIISYVIKPEDIEWEMDWSGLKKDGTRQHPDKPEKEIIFEKGPALAILLINEVIFLNSHHWEKEWPEAARKATSLNVNCNDVFAWGCADSEEISTDELKDLWRLFKEHGHSGATLWCMKKRREMPQGPVADLIREAGVDLDGFQKENNLRNNFYDGVCGLEAAHRYKAYVDWARSIGKEVLAFDKNWWNGWSEFIKANPDWTKDIGNRECASIRKQFIAENGYDEISE